MYSPTRAAKLLRLTQRLYVSRKSPTLHLLRPIQKLDHQTSFHMPNIMAMERPHARVIVRESQQRVSIRRDGDRISTDGVYALQSIRGVEFAIVLRPVEVCLIGNLKNPELVTVQMEWMSAVIEVLDEDVDDVL